MYPYTYHIETYKKYYVLQQTKEKDTLLCGTIYKQDEAHWKTVINIITILSLQDTFSFPHTLCAYNINDQEIAKIQPKFSLNHLSFKLWIHNELFSLKEHKDELLRSIYTCTLNDAAIVITSNFKADYFVHIADEQVATIYKLDDVVEIQTIIQDENLLLLIAILYLSVTAR